MPGNRRAAPIALAGRQSTGGAKGGTPYLFGTYCTGGRVSTTRLRFLVTVIVYPLARGPLVAVT